MPEGFNDTLLSIMAQAGMDAATHGSIHTAIPDATGSNASAAARQALSWDLSVAGDLLLTTEEVFTGGTANGPAVALGLWSAVSGGTFYGYFLTTGDQTFDDAGEYRVQAITITGSSQGA